MTTLYRGMKVDPVDGLPLAEQSARGLGVRAGVDIPVDDFGLVPEGAGGMSVSPDAIENLPEHRRPPEHGGDGDDPVWEIDEEELGGLLAYTPDSDSARPHGFVEPAYQMPLEDYQLALAETRQLWRQC
jgi:hypothetical protein